MARGMIRARKFSGSGLAAALVLACTAALPALAQSVSDFKLQPRETATPRPQGPVDGDAPVVRPVVREVPAEAPPAAQPSPAPSATASAAAPAPRTRPAGVPAPAASATPRAQTAPAAEASVSPTAAPTVTEAPVVEPSADSPEPVVIATFEPSPGSRGGLPFDWWWLAAPAAVLLALAIWLLRRGRSAAEPEDEAETFEEPAAQPQPAPVVKATAPAAQPEPPTPLAPPPVNQWSGDTLAISLEVGRMSATLVNATLTWKLTVANRGDALLGPIMVAGDMIAAHASLPVEQQLATDGQPLELIDELATIAPGEQAEISGEFRVPLSSINPIKAGSALLFIPLLRFRVEAEAASTLATFAIGETPPVAAAALLPFRLDLGPRVWPRISHRQVDREVVSA